MEDRRKNHRLDNNQRSRQKECGMVNISEGGGGDLTWFFPSLVLNLPTAHNAPVSQPLHNGSPIPGLECIAGSLEEVSFHHYSIGSINVEFHLGFIVREILKAQSTGRRGKDMSWCWDCFPWLIQQSDPKYLYAKKVVLI